MSRVHDILTMQTVYSIERGDARKAQKILRENMSFLGEDVSVHVESFGHDDEALQLVLKFNRTNIKIIHIQKSGFHRGRFRRTKLEAVPLFSHLQHLSFSSISFDSEEITSLSEVSRVGNLPCLTQLSFAYCSSLGSNLSLLCRSPWGQLAHLGFQECSLNFEDLEIIANTQDDKFPNISSLSIANDSAVIAHLNDRVINLQSLNFKTYNPPEGEAIKWKPTSNLKSLYLEIDNTKEGTSITYGSLPPCPESLALIRCVGSLQTLADNLFRNNLKRLDVSFNMTIKGTLSILMGDIFPSLATLILRGCYLNSADLSSLALANVERRLPKLRHLDISNNDLCRIEDGLFASSCKWKQLLSLNITDTGFSHDELHRKVQSDCLVSLQELRIEGYPRYRVDIIWPHLKILGITCPNDMMLSNCADAVNEGKLPVLHSVCLDTDSCDIKSDLHRFSAFYSFTEANLLCHERVVDGFGFTETKCPCQAILPT